MDERVSDEGDRGRSVTPVERPRWTCSACGLRRRSGTRDTPRTPPYWTWICGRLLCGNCSAAYTPKRAKNTVTDEREEREAA